MLTELVLWLQFKLLPLVDRLTALPLMYAGDTLLCVYSWLPCSIMQPMVTFLSYVEIHCLLCSKHPTIPYPHIKPYHALTLQHFLFKKLYFVGRESGLAWVISKLDVQWWQGEVEMTWSDNSPSDWKFSICVAVIDFDNSDPAWRDYDASKLQATFLLNKQSTHAKCNT